MRIPCGTRALVSYQTRLLAPGGKALHLFPSALRRNNSSRSCVMQYQVAHGPLALAREQTPASAARARPRWRGMWFATSTHAKARAPVLGDQTNRLGQSWPHLIALAILPRANRVAIPHCPCPSLNSSCQSASGCSTVFVGQIADDHCANGIFAVLQR